MKGQIILPKFYETRYTDNYKFLLHAIADKYNFSYEYTDDPIIKDDTNVVIAYAIPQHNRPDYPIESFISLSNNIKLTLYYGDLQSYGKQKCEDSFLAMFDRANLIVGCSWIGFNAWYKEYLSKYEFLPQFFSTYNRYAQLPFDKQPRYGKLCFLSGATNEKYYPLRNYVLENRDPNFIRYLPSPSQVNHDYKFRRYAQLLNEFFCCITDGGGENNLDRIAVKKHCEIPAAGSLLITNRVEELDMMGFIPDTHYLPVTTNNVLDTIYDALSRPDDFIEMRRGARKFVLANHSERNRFEQLSVYLDKWREEFDG